MLRSSIYEKFYEREYRFASARTRDSIENLDPPLDEDIPTPIDPFEKSKSVKPYRPPTEFDPMSSSPFGSVLDAPLN